MIDNDDERSFSYQGIPEEDAWLISKLLFTWQNSLFKRADNLSRRKEALEQEDLIPLPRRDYGDVLATIFENAWGAYSAKSSGKRFDNDKDIKAGAPRLRRAISHVLGWKFVFAGFIKAVNTALQFGFPLLLNGILIFIEDNQNGNISESDPWHDRYRGYWLSALLLMVMGSKAITENAYFHICNRGAFQVKAAITVAVYNKSLRLSNAERQSTTVGELVNLMQVDASKIETFIPQFHVLWDGIFQITGYMTILYTLIGPSCFAGLFVMILAGPVQGIVMKKLFGMNRKIVKHTDARVESINEALQGIQGVKMYTWEDNVSKKVKGFRKKELEHLKDAAYLKAFSRAYMGALPGIVTVVSFAVYAVLGSAEISASRLFAALIAFDQLRFPLLFYPMSLAQFVQAQVSAARLEIFLEMGEVTKSGGAGEGKYVRKYGSEGGIVIKDAELYWSDPRIPLDLPKEEKISDDASTAGSTDFLTESSSLDLSNHTSVVDTKSQDTESVQQQAVSFPKAVCKNINIEIQTGELCAVVGKVASGKSTLCSAILNETFLDRGEIVLNGKVAFAAQSPWILNDTLRENILFGKPMNEEKYERVIRTCQLEHDLTMFEDADLTDIGEKGINLSGGQKARISVARAAYSDADTIILDDPLSALDPEVATKLFNECIAGDLMAKKTRLLVTNQLQFLGACDHIIVLKKGKVMEDGTSLYLLGKEDSEVNRLVAKIASAKPKGSEFYDYGAEKQDKSTREKKSKETRSSIATSKSTKLLSKEERNIGAVSLSVYLKYIKAGGGYSVFSGLYTGYIITALTDAARVSWISYWTTDAAYQRHERAFYLGIFAVIAVALGVFQYIRSYLLARFGVVASGKLHEDLLKSILRAPQSFFDTTPLGRILSRFSKDIYSIDLELDDTIEFVLLCSLTVLISMLSIVAVTPWFGVAIVPLGYTYFYYLQYFRSVSRETKRLDSISRSPVYAQFSETLGGLSTIRAYGDLDRFKKEFQQKVNMQTQAQYNNKAAERWLSTRLEMLGATIAGIASALASHLAISDSKAGISTGGNSLASFVGLSLTYAISVTGLLQWTVRSFSNMENAMNATERILFYSEETPVEAPWSTDEMEHSATTMRNNLRKDLKPSYSLAMTAAGGKSEKIRPGWPEKGALELKNLKLRYRQDTPLVLKGLNITIASGERIGIVGRTGSGKSSLLLSLLRIVEPTLDENISVENYVSPIRIDGVDILRIGLRDLRSKLGIIPQNPVLLSGTIRSNIDPFDEYTSEEIWAALEQCGLKESVEAMSDQLGASVSEYGQNLSSGMRQMLVLGRALLRKCKILLLDEATASVDIETDHEIQKTIQEAFCGCTILTVAHRINTIMNSDKILVLKDGVAEEFAPPQDLLKRENSLFADIVRHAQVDERKD